MSNQKRKRIEANDWPLPEIPSKRYFTISEVGQLCQLRPHVLRYWEQEFSTLSPSKRRGRRYYQRKDIEMVLLIKALLYKEGYTIEGARQRLQWLRKKPEFEYLMIPSEPPTATSHPTAEAERLNRLQDAVADLERLLETLEVHPEKTSV